MIPIDLRQMALLRVSSIPDRWCPLGCQSRGGARSINLKSGATSVGQVGLPISRPSYRLSRQKLSDGVHGGGDGAGVIQSRNTRYVRRSDSRHVVVGNTLQSVFNLSAKWLTLFVAEAIVLLVAVFTHTSELSGYFVAILNGCLVYSSAVGLNTMTSKPPPSEPPSARSADEAGLPPRPDVHRSFFSRWW